MFPDKCEAGGPPSYSAFLCFSGRQLIGCGPPTLGTALLYSVHRFKCSSPEALSHWPHAPAKPVHETSQRGTILHVLLSRASARGRWAVPTSWLLQIMPL